MTVNLVYVGFDMLTISLITLVSMRFDFIKLECEKIGADFRPDNETIDIVKDIVNRHEEVFELGRKLESHFTAIFYNYIQSAFSLCYTALLMSTGDSLYGSLTELPTFLPIAFKSMRYAISDRS